MVLRGEVGSSRGRVLLSSTEPTGGSFTDGGLAAGTYTYVVISVDANNKNTGHSNPVQVVIAPAPPAAPPTTAAPPTAPTDAQEPSTTAAEPPAAPPAGDQPTV